MGDAAGNLVYQVHSPLACGGCCAPDGQSKCCTNCCAPTCFAPVYTSTIHDAATMQAVATFENQWPGWNLRGCCQANSAASNYVLKFPVNATPEDKAPITTGLMLTNFMFF